MSNYYKVKENAMRQLKTQIEDLERFVHFLQISASEAGALLLTSIILRLILFPMMHFSVLVAMLRLRSLLDNRMARISCAGNASSTEFCAAGQN